MWPMEYMFPVLDIMKNVVVEYANGMEVVVEHPGFDFEQFLKQIQYEDQ